MVISRRPLRTASACGRARHLWPTASGVAARRRIDPFSALVADGQDEFDDDIDDLDDDEDSEFEDDPDDEFELDDDELDDDLDDDSEEDDLDDDLDDGFDDLDD